MVEMILWPLMLDEGQHRGHDYRLAVRIMCKDIVDTQQKTRRGQMLEIACPSMNNDGDGELLSGAVGLCSAT